MIKFTGYELYSAQGFCPTDKFFLPCCNWPLPSTTCSLLSSAFYDAIAHLAERTAVSFQNLISKESKNTRLSRKPPSNFTKTKEALQASMKAICMLLIHSWNTSGNFSLCNQPIPPLPLTASFSSSSSSSGRELSILCILLTDVVLFLCDSVSKSLSKRTWSTGSGWKGLGSAGGFGVP